MAADSEFAYLRGFDLGKTDLDTFFPPVVFEMHSLRWLRLKHNRLAGLPDKLWELTNLDRLDIGCNKLANLPSDVTKLQKLETVSLRHNSFGQDLNPAVFQLQLRRINLSHNNLQTVPQALLGVPRTGLVVLSLSHNQIKHIPSEFTARMPKLQVLDLGYNLLRSAPENLLLCTDLDTLSLAHNKLRYVDAMVCEATQLRSLDLHGNGFRVNDVPDSMAKLTNLTQLYLQDNNLESVPPPIYKLVNLRHINLSGNSVDYFDGEIKNMTVLRTLNLSRNGFHKLPPMLCRVTALRRLDLNGNFLSTDGISLNLRYLENLEVLSLSNNKLDALPRAVFMCLSLKKLDLSYNQLRTLPHQVYKLTNLRELDVTGNEGFVMPRRKDIPDGYMTMDEEHLKQIMISQQQSLLHRAQNREGERGMASWRSTTDNTLLRPNRRVNRREGMANTFINALGKSRGASQDVSVSEDLCVTPARPGLYDDDDDDDDDVPRRTVAPAVKGGVPPPPPPPPPPKKTWLDLIEKPKMDLSVVFGELELEEGVTMWHIDHFRPMRVDLDAYGVFYTKESYLVLLGTWNEENRGLDFKVFYWIGKESPLDKAACAAMHAVYLAQYTHCKEKSSREEQGEESEEFKAGFNMFDITYEDGQYSPSMLDKPEKKDFDVHLYCFNAKSGGKPMLMEQTLERFGKRDVYVLDKGLLVFVYNGSESNIIHRSKARLHAEELVKERKARRPKPRVVDVLEARTEEPRLFEEFMQYFTEYSEYSYEEVSEAAGEEIIEEVVEEVEEDGDADADADADADEDAESTGTQQADETAANTTTGTAINTTLNLSAVPKVVDTTLRGDDVTQVMDGEEEEVEMEEVCVPATPPNVSINASTLQQLPREMPRLLEEHDEAWVAQKEREDEERMARGEHSEDSGEDGVVRPHRTAKERPRVNLYEVDVGSCLELPQVDGVLSRSLLKSEKAYILDCTTDIYVWLGKKTKRLQKKAALAFVPKFLVIFDRPRWTRLDRVLETAEPIGFISKFHDWDEQTGLKVNYGRTLKGSYEDGPGGPALVSIGGHTQTDASHLKKPLKFKIEDLYVMPSAPTGRVRSRSTGSASSALDDSAAGLSLAVPAPPAPPRYRGECMYKCYFNGKDFVRVRHEDISEFYSGDAYVLICKGAKFDESFGDFERDKCVIYYWEGRNASKKAWLQYQFQVRRRVERLVDDTFSMKPSFERVEQQREPGLLLACVNNVMVIYSGSRPRHADEEATVEGESSSSDEESGSEASGEERRTPSPTKRPAQSPLQASRAADADADAGSEGTQEAEEAEGTPPRGQGNETVDISHVQKANESDLESDDDGSGSTATANSDDATPRTAKKKKRPTTSTSTRSGVPPPPPPPPKAASRTFIGIPPKRTPRRPPRTPSRVLLRAGEAAVTRETTDADRAPDVRRLLQCDAADASEGGMRAIEVACACRSLTPQSTFVLLTPGRVFVRSPTFRGPGGEHDDAGVQRVVDVVNIKRYPRHPVRAGEEPSAFFSVLEGGKGEAAADDERVLPSQVRLLRCTLEHDTFIVKEQKPFSQADLGPRDVVLLDTTANIYMWEGAEAGEQLRKLSWTAAETYFNTSERSSPRAQVVRVNAGSEPKAFTRWFVAWDNSVFQKAQFVDPYEKRWQGVLAAWKDDMRAESKRRMAEAKAAREVAMQKERQRKEAEERARRELERQQAQHKLGLNAVLGELRVQRDNQDELARQRAQEDERLAAETERRAKEAAVEKRRRDEEERYIRERDEARRVARDKAEEKERERDRRKMEARAEREKRAQERRAQELKRLEELKIQAETKAKTQEERLEALRKRREMEREKTEAQKEMMLQFVRQRDLEEAHATDALLRKAHQMKA